MNVLFGNGGCAQNLHLTQLGHTYVSCNPGYYKDSIGPCIYAQVS